MVIKEKTSNTITVSFSGNVGKDGLMRIKNFVEFLEKSGNWKRKKVSKSVADKLADEINEAAWKKFRKVKRLK